MLELTVKELEKTNSDLLAEISNLKDTITAMHSSANKNVLLISSLQIQITKQQEIIGQHQQGSVHTYKGSTESAVPKVKFF